jgi:hypothetical protein
LNIQVKFGYIGISLFIGEGWSQRSYKLGKIFHYLYLGLALWAVYVTSSPILNPVIPGLI